MRIARRHGRGEPRPARTTPTGTTAGRTMADRNQSPGTPTVPSERTAAAGRRRAPRRHWPPKTPRWHPNWHLGPDNATLNSV